MIKSLIFLVLLTFFSGANAAGEETKDTSQAAIQPLKISLLQRAFSGRMYIKKGKNFDHFTVLVENVSDRPFKLWGGLANKGYESLSFLFTDEMGITSKVQRTPYIGSERDHSEVFPPGEKRIIEVYPDSKDWQGFPDAPDAPKEFTLKIVYESLETKKEAVGWSGRVESMEYKILYVKSP